MDFAFTPDGQTVIAARATFDPPDSRRPNVLPPDLVISGFDANTGATRFHRVLGRGMRIDGLSMISGGAFVILHHPGEASTVWDIAAGKRLDTIGPFYQLLEARDHGLIVLRPRGELELVDAATGKTRFVLRGSEHCGCLAFSPQGNLLAAQRDRSQLMIWDLATNRIARQRRVGPSPEFYPTDCVPSPDGTLLAIAHRDARIQLWDAGTLELRHTLLGHSNSIHGLAFSPDGRTLVSTSSDGTVRLWNVTSGEELLPLRHWTSQGELSRPQFASDGLTLGFVALHADGTRLFLVPTALPDDLDSKEGP
jgi:WD40 repeat protein